MPALKTKELRRVRGETIKLRLTVRDELGNPVDLTGATMHLRVRADLKAAAIVSLLTASGIVHATQSGATLGQATATIPHTAFAALDPGDYVWDAWILTAGGERYTVVAPSRLTILHEVSTIP